MWLYTILSYTYIWIINNIEIIYTSIINTQLTFIDNFVETNNTYQVFTLTLKYLLVKTEFFSYPGEKNHPRKKWHFFKACLLIHKTEQYCISWWNHAIFILSALKLETKSWKNKMLLTNHWNNSFSLRKIWIYIVNMIPYLKFSI